MMKHADFHVGMEFRCGERLWRCTDVGTRTIAAIRIDQVELRRILNRTEAEAEGWFKGPPYSGGEILFDEDDFEDCDPP